ncbi:hypothetical protein IF1G_09023 [Cordyceps javanica]|uniref:Uncharacterized protein n=1 Tax=Cordyceps javanica TaxID=43265 RepID=A0A545UST9_9HYPO|nr:hypothetical protein IF1G_09023 [Cordyceps javanica]
MFFFLQPQRLPSCTHGFRHSLSQPTPLLFPPSQSYHNRLRTLFVLVPLYFDSFALSQGRRQTLGQFSNLPYFIPSWLRNSTSCRKYHHRLLFITLFNCHTPLESSLYVSQKSSS